MLTYRIFLHTNAGEEPWSAQPHLQPVRAVPECVTDPTSKWYEFYDAEAADACLAVAATAKTMTRARHRVEKIDGVKAALGRASVKSEFDDGKVISSWWGYGSLVHLVFPYGRGTPEGFYARSRGPSLSSLFNVSMLHIGHMTKVSVEQMCSGHLFRLANLAHTG
jgi:hypothetical protein